MPTSIMGYYDDDESETGLPILPINGRMPIPASAATNDYDDNETGLPPIANNNRNNHHIMDNFDEEITGFENANMRNNRQQPPQPAARNSTGSSPPPSDPEPPVPNFYQQRKQEPKKTNIKDFTEELIFTLASKFTGYKEINELKADLHKDSGYQPDWVALEFGFPNFDTFIKSDEMKKYVKMTTINGEIYYMPKDFSRFEHIRKEQEITQNADILSIEKDEQEKLVRALLPENRAAALDGRKRISEILYELGGDKKQILWVDIQKKYREKYDVDLAGAELKRFFQRDKALAIVQSIFNKEVQLFDSNTAGHFFLKLKIPYSELIEYYEEQMHSQSEATRKLEEIRRGNKTYHYHPAPGPGKHRKEIIPTEPYLPEPSPETTAFLSERPSTSAAAGISFGGRPPQSAPIMTNAAAATNNNGIARSKFDLSPEDMAVKPRANNFDKVLTNSGNVQEEGDGAIRWADNDILPAYQVGQDNSQPPVLRSNNNGNGSDGNEVQKKKKKYTDAHDNADMTDTDESGGSDDEGTLVNGHSGQPKPNSLVNPNANNAKTISALPPVRLSTHQKSILGYMEQKTAEKKAAAGAGTNKSHSHPQQLNIASTGGGTGTRYNQSAVGQNLNISESEDDGENEAPIRPQQQSKPQQSSAYISAPSVAAAINTNRQQHQPQPATLLQQHQQSTMLNSIAATPTPYVPMPTASVPPSPFVGNLNASMPQYNQYPSPMTPIMANGGGQQYQQQLLSPPTHGNWKLMDQTESLRALASVKQLSTESRMDEGSFAFRNTALILMLTECGDEIRASSHVNGAIIGERRYPKVDWDMFKQTIRGLIEETFFATANSIRR